MAAQSSPRLRFYLKVKQIVPDYYREPPSPNRPIRPPTTTEGVSVKNHTRWYEWEQGSLNNVPDNLQNSIRIHRTTSMFFIHSLAGYMHVPFDCKEIAVRDRVRHKPLDDWKDTMFHCNPNNRLTFVGHAYSGPNVGAVVPSAWLGQLMPDKYKCPRGHDGAERQIYPTVCRLAGDLSLLVALALFSAPLQFFHLVMCTSFRAGPHGTDWVRHNKLDGRHDQSGLIVSIGYDNRTVLQDTLRRWEDGDFGPIIT